MDSIGGDHFAAYKQYKEDTENIAGWLAFNSLQCRCQIDQSPPSSTTTTGPSKRLKGKARTQGYGAKISKSSKRPIQSKHPISVSDFSFMAKTIADFRPKVIVPEALDNLFRRAIDTRREFTQWYQKHCPEEKESNERHAHFTSVLTNTWEILRPFKAARTAPATKKKKENPPKIPEPEDTSASLSNRFSRLEVEEPSEQGPQNETSSSAELDDNNYELTDIEPVKLVKTQEDLEADFFFAIIAFMKELDEVRSYIRTIWKSYSQDTAELILPSLVTNTAIQLVRRAEHELDLLVERPEKYPSSSYPSGTFPDIFIVQALADFVKPTSWCPRFSCSHAEICLLDTFAALKHSLFEYTSRGRRYMLGDGYGGNETETFRRINRILPYLAGVATGLRGRFAFASDEITSAVGYMFRTETIPIWVAFGVRLLLDIQDELQTVPGKALWEVQTHTIDKLSEYKSRKFDEPTVDNDKARLLLPMLNEYQSVALANNFQLMFLRSGLIDSSGRPIQLNRGPLNDRPGPPEFFRDPDYFLRINPLKCGMLKYGLYLHTHSYVADHLEETWLGITCMLQLYVTCRTLWPLDPVWHDMEYFMHHQDVEHLFYGRVPKTWNGFYKKFMLAAGYQISSFAKNSRVKSPQAKKHRRRVSNPCLLDSILMPWMASGSGRDDAMILKLTSTISDPKSYAAKARQAGLGPVVKENVNEKLDKTRSKPDRGTVNILKNMEFFIKTENSDLFFDWLSFAETCQGIWKQIYALYDFNGAKHAFPLAMTALIMIDAEEYHTTAKTLDEDLASSTFKSARSLLSQTWQVIQAHIKMDTEVSFEGDDHYKDAKVWLGDQELFNMSIILDESQYLDMAPEFVQSVYKNWPEAELRRRAVRRMKKTDLSNPNVSGQSDKDSGK
ncbi:hypothetical protein F5B20DRAFT_588088 [Whalleya microplaca]|nr:hypothetical protein F5B20DRAFT_588088 [Whalleya microplaca]